MANETYVSIDEPSGVLSELNSFNNPLQLTRNQIAYARNWFFTQNGMRTKFGSVVFKDVDNGDSDIDGNIIFMDVFSPDDFEYYYHFIGTDTGYLYFAKFSETGAITQTEVTDLTLSDYPADILKLDLQDNSTVLNELTRVKNFQYAILRSPTATQGGSPSHWQKTPAFDSTAGFISSATINNKIYFVDGTSTLYVFDGTLGTGRKLSTVNITKTEFNSSTDNIVAIFTYNNKLWFVTSTDKMFASAPGDGDTFQDADGFYVKLGRIDGMDIKNVVPTKNGVFIGLSNPRIFRTQTKVLTGSSNSTYRVDEVVNTSGVLGSSGKEINSDFMALTEYGFVNISAFGENDRFGLTEQDTISSKVNGDVFTGLIESKVNATYYSGVGNRKRNWYCCQLSNTNFAIYDINFSTPKVPKWSFFEFPFNVKYHRGLLNRWFIVDNNNNVLMTDAPFTFTDNGTNYTKSFRSFAFGKDAVGRDLMNEYAGIEKQFKDISIHGIIPGNTQEATVLPIYDGVPVTVLPDGTDFSQVELTPTVANDITLASTILLSSTVTLGSFEYETIHKKISDRAGTARTMQIDFTEEGPLDLEIISLGATYTMNKKSFDNVNTS